MILTETKTKYPYTASILTNTGCNLSCSYCFESWENKTYVASIRDIIDFLDAMDLLYADRDSCIVDMIGGESFLELELLIAICDHVRTRKNKKYTLNITTNGTLFGDAKVREFVEHNRDILAIGVSVDGIKEVHDKNRCNSYDEVVKNLPWLFSALPHCRIGAKGTFTTKDFIRYGYAAHINLINLGFEEIACTIAVEEKNTLEDGIGIARVFIDLFDWLVEKNLFDKIRLPAFGSKEDLALNNEKLFSKQGLYENETINFCGTGIHMKCLGENRKIYGCHRYATANRVSLGILNRENKIEINQENYNKIVRHNQNFDKECQLCIFGRQKEPACRGCLAMNELSDMSTAKNTCGWTYGVALARFYACCKLAGLAKRMSAAAS